MLPVDEYTEDHFVFMATANGTVKKTPLEQFSRPRTSGLIALALDEGDTLISAAVTDGSREVMLFSDGGKVTRFKETDVRAMGRTARGVRGMRIAEDQKLISMLIPEEGRDRKSTRLNSSHVRISYAVFCLEKKQVGPS